MWIFTKDGFLSIVQHADDKDWMRVRSRVKADLERAFPALAENIEDMSYRANYDYRWHLDVPRNDVIVYMLNTTQQIDYDSHVKDVIGTHAPAERMTAMYSIWNAMYQLDHPTPKTARRGNLWDDEFWEGVNNDGVTAELD